MSIKKALKMKKNYEDYLQSNPKSKKWLIKSIMFIEKYINYLKSK